MTEPIVPSAPAPAAPAGPAAVSALFTLPGLLRIVEGALTAGVGSFAASLSEFNAGTWSARNFAAAGIGAAVAAAYHIVKSLPAS